jgi:hypothetical protein
MSGAGARSTTLIGNVVGACKLGVSVCFDRTAGGAIDELALA